MATPLRGANRQWTGVTHAGKYKSATGSRVLRRQMSHLLIGDCSFEPSAADAAMGDRAD